MLYLLGLKSRSIKWGLLLLCGLAVIISFMWGSEIKNFFICTEQTATNNNPVTVSVFVSDQYILSPITIPYCEGDTVLDALLSVSRSKKVNVKKKGWGPGAYIVQIGHLSGGWVYRVNGKSASVGCGSYKIQPGDTIQWYFKDLKRNAS